MKDKEIKATQKSGIQLPKWLHLLFPRVSSAAGYKFVRFAHEEASIEWIRKKMAESAVVRALVEEASKENPEIGAALSGLKVSTSRKDGK
jgi:hypothetical protein